MTAGRIWGVVSALSLDMDGEEMCFLGPRIRVGTGGGDDVKLRKIGALLSSESPLFEVVKTTTGWKMGHAIRGVLINDGDAEAGREIKPGDMIELPGVVSIYIKRVETFSETATDEDAETERRAAAWKPISVDDFEKCLSKMARSSGVGISPEHRLSQETVDRIRANRNAIMASSPDEAAAIVEDLQRKAEAQKRQTEELKAFSAYVHGGGLPENYEPQDNWVRGDWMQTFTGVAFYPLDPHPSKIRLEDIAHSLALQCRYAGHLRAFYSVGQHSVMASWVDPFCSRAEKMQRLLHDAPEAYCQDVVRPLKRNLRDYKEIETRIASAIEQWACLPHGSFGLPHVKRADLVMLLTEKRDLLVREPQPRSTGQKSDEIGEPLSQKIRPWGWRQAEVRFLARFHELKGNTSWRLDALSRRPELALGFIAWGIDAIRGFIMGDLL